MVNLQKGLICLLDQTGLICLLDCMMRLYDVVKNSIRPGLSPA